MKLAQFNDLCQREWMRGNFVHGDVTALHLTGPSAAELSADAIATGGSAAWVPKVLRITEEEAKEFRAGAAVSEILNPVTRSVVRIFRDAETDKAEVSFGPSREPEMVPC